MLPGQPQPRHPAVLFVVTQAAEVKPGQPTGLWLEEFAVPYLRLRELGAEVTVATVRGGAVPIDPRSAAKPEQAEAWKPALEALQQTQALASVDPARFQAIVIPGGHGAMFDLPDNEPLAGVLAHFAEQDKIVASLCHGPAALVGVKLSSGRFLVQGKQLTAFTNAEEEASGLAPEMPFALETRLGQEGAEFSAGPNYQAHVVRDGWLVTGQNPASSSELADQLIAMLREQGYLLSK